MGNGVNWTEIENDIKTYKQNLIGEDNAVDLSAAGLTAVLQKLVSQIKVTTTINNTQTICVEGAPLSGNATGTGGTS